MSSTLYAAAVLSIILAACASPVVERPDFNGTWRLNTGRSTYPKGVTPPDGRVEDIEQYDQTLKVSVTHIAQGRTQRYTTAQSLTGSQSSNSVAGTLVTSRASWDSGALIIRSTLKTPNGTIESVDRMTVSGDAKNRTMTREQRVLTGQGMVIIHVYEKQ